MDFTVVIVGSLLIFNATLTTTNASGICYYVPVAYYSCGEEIKWDSLTVSSSNSTYIITAKAHVNPMLTVVVVFADNKVVIPGSAPWIIDFLILMTHVILLLTVVVIWKRREQLQLS